VEFKYLIIAVLVAIVISLGKALFHMTHAEENQGAKMVNALAWRIGLSVGWFVLLIAAYHYGWIDPPRVSSGSP